MNLYPLGTNYFSVLPKKKTRAMFGSNNLIVRYGTHGDGTCFYYSLCAILNKDNYLSKPLRQQLAIGRRLRCSFTKSLTWEEWTEFLEYKGITNSEVQNLTELKKKMCSYQVWADEPVIRFIMYKLRVNLIFLDERLNRLYCGVTEPESDLTAVILWVNKSHFEPLGRLNALDGDKDKVAVQFQFFPGEDSEFIDTLMNFYVDTCVVEK